MTGFARDHLGTLLVLADEGTFERAAARLQVTASAVSQRIKTMEQAAGQILVERTNPVRPTAAGDVVLRLARQVQLVENEALAELGQSGTGAGRATVAVAVNSDSLATWFLRALASAAQQLDVVFDVHADDQEYTAGLLRSGTVMAAVTSIPEPVQGCSVTGLGTMRYFAVASPAFVARWGGAGILSSWLASAPLVDFDHKDGLQRGFLERRGMDARDSPRNVVPTSADFARAVVLGLGWGMLPERQCLDDLAQGTLVTLAPDDPTDVPLFWQRWNLDSRLLDALTVAVHEAAAEALQPTLGR
ncbi:LysR family transcriptional regulator ArgP [Subtercola boreus]|uniref:Transcriptional regulator ArgP n=1 Tax=Subtercola boreus TaxID=120213 RepID=A0A3E0W7Q5_9MICO|nr:LysR family transcriptional regulator ArgP [Subtercola boreus]RFA19043.1 transcriptional regulator ArgP [Subtercola boreus]RFA19181.1 transcriptional regulator ArgP [Subtercola boreus]RFA25643.1 transcriptional regulator ArgP [Subtercola boreus]